MKKYFAAVGAVFVLGFVGYFLFFDNTSDKEDRQAGQVQRVVKVTRGDLYLNVSSDGVVQPINKVEIRSKAGGKIVQLNFIEGQYVKTGELLILVDQTTTKNNMDQAKADLETAQANLVQAQNNDTRMKELFMKGLVSQQEIDQSNTDLVRAQAQLVKAQAALSTAEDQMNDTRIVAPVSGIVLSKSVELGQIISSATSNVGGGTLLATIADMNEVYVYAKVDEVDIGKVKVGQNANVIADAYPEDTFGGRVERIAPQGQTLQNVTTFDVIVLVRNQGLRLKAGMSASVDIQVFNRVNVLLLPNEAFKDPKSEQGRELMAEANMTFPAESTVTSEVKVNESGEEDDKQSHRTSENNISPVEKEKSRLQMRARFEKMTPEEREKVRSEWGKRMQQSSPSNEARASRSKQRRQAQVTNENDVRWRIVLAKEGNDYKPRMVKAGPSNFDNTEIIQGLNEGDEILITSISRAKIASDKMTERIRSSGSLGGSGGGRVR